MLLAARFILGASLERTESRLSHFREDFEARDDANWLVWVDITERDGKPEFSRTPIPTPLCDVRRCAVRRGKSARRSAACSLAPEAFGLLHLKDAALLPLIVFERQFGGNVDGPLFRLANNPDIAAVEHEVVPLRGIGHAADQGRRNC